VTATSITTENATITWTTDESSNSTVYYGTSSSTLDNTVTDNSSVTSHSIKLSGLTSNTTYYYKVKSCDASGNCKESDVYNFTTAEPNNPPNITDVSITPDPAYTTTDLTCNGTFSDPDGDAESGSTFRWFINGTEIAGETSKTLSSSNFAKGDEIICEYTPSDGIDYGNPVNSSVLTINNSEPSVEDVTITPSPANVTAGDNLTCTYSFIDDDNDSDASTFKWFKSTDNGTTWSDTGISGSTVDNSNLAVDEQWICEVTPCDGTGCGEPVNSTAVQIVS
ncbi:MAG: fibronectin type III domain-containing protein, partial [Candidatus Diapherotrites archaeon]|nr:fibronectin type III domain-containing protein [Candidatus Diapherotrites archaeon]